MLQISLIVFQLDGAKWPRTQALWHLCMYRISAKSFITLWWFFLSWYCRSKGDFKPIAATLNDLQLHFKINKEKINTDQPRFHIASFCVLGLFYLKCKCIEHFYSYVLRVRRALGLLGEIRKTYCVLVAMLMICEPLVNLRNLVQSFRSWTLWRVVTYRNRAWQSLE